MNGRKPVASDTRKNFRSVVDSTEVSNKERRTHLADTINGTRLELLNLLNLPTDLAGKGDWTPVQKTIHEELKKTEDLSVRAEADRCIDRLLDAEAELVEGNLRLVLMVVRRYARGVTGALEEMDFVQEGCEGLLDAVRRFDFSGSGGFLTYALIRIRKKVILAMEKQHRLVRIPAHVIRKGRYLKEVIDDFASEKGRYPAPHEIEIETGGDMDWSILLSLSETVDSIHETVGKTGLPLEEQLASSAVEPGIPLLDELVEDALKKLDKRAKFILVMRYGLLDGDTHRLADIAEVLGLSAERTRQIEKASIKILRDNFSDFDISDWLQ
ncbi:MAG: sigma-70 family RNA polymerase sigma factor [Candidatus Sabulitectum sp.]|nr:sigma-70 family RNA polymerase sigma factor [Candidatus Sabulitectum sp.]